MLDVRQVRRPRRVRWRSFAAGQGSFRVTAIMSSSSMSEFDKWCIALLSIWVFCSVVGNVSVIACIWKVSRENRRRTGQRSVTSIDLLIISLALNDIMLAGVVLPQKIHDISHTHHFFERKSITSPTMLPHHHHQQQQRRRRRRRLFNDNQVIKPRPQNCYAKVWWSLLQFNY